jgi:hypothetical protein
MKLKGMILKGCRTIQTSRFEVVYMCVFEQNEDIDGVEVGSYADFDFLRSCVTKTSESGVAGSKYPTLIHHSDCDGEWSTKEIESLRNELASEETCVSS